MIPNSGLGFSGEALRRRGDYVQAELLLRTAVERAELAQPFDAMSLAIALNGLGLVCKDLAKYDEARAAYQRALALFEEQSGPNADWVATVYHNLGGIEHASGNYAAGEPLARLGLAIRRRSGASEDLVAADMAALAAILDALHKHDEAENLYLAALAVFERSPESNRGEIAVILNGLGALRARRGQFEEAEVLLTRAVELKRATLGHHHADVAVTLNNLGLVYKHRGDFARARETYRVAVEIFDECLGAEHPKTIACQMNHARCLADGASRSP